MQVGEVLAARFELLALAGRGGMGEVFRARDRETGAIVALKTLAGSNDADHQRFQREAEVLAAVRHPAIVRYVAHGVAAQGTRWLVMEWIDGQSLSARIGRQGLTVAETVAIGARVAEALGALHDQGIVHRDLKPSNLMLPGGDAARVMLIDFGIARVSADGSALTMTGAMLGTPGYMAPEQARGQRGIDLRADLFALGAVLFHCAAGRPPFEAEDRMAVLLKVVLEDAPRLAEWADAPAELDELVAELLAKEPSDRPRDAKVVAARLESISKDLPDAPVSARAPASTVLSHITESERRVASLVLARLPDEDITIVRPAGPRGTVMMPSSPRRPASVDARAVASIAETFGGRADVFPDGSCAIVLGAAAATDLADRAARAALALRAALPGTELAVVSGHSVLAGRAPIGALIDAAIALLALSGAEGAIALDEVTSGLLGAAFELRRDERGTKLLASEPAPRDLSRNPVGPSTPFVGREREIASLEALFVESALESVARAVVITGAPGVGKTRLRRELLNRVRARVLAEGLPEPTLWIARADALRSGAAFGLAAELVCGAVGVPEGAPADMKRERLVAALDAASSVPDAPRVAAFLGELVGAPFPDEGDVQLYAARQDPVLMGDQIRRAFEDLLRAACARGPVAIVIEDVQWADPPTVTLLDASLRHLRAAPLVVLAMARPEVDQVFPRLWIERGVLAMVLAELTPRAAERLVQRLLGPASSSSLVAQIVERADGNPFYLEELARFAAEGRHAEMPATVIAMIATRLEALPSELRRVLRAASVFGQRFWRGGVAALLGDEAAADVGPFLRDLERREIVVRRETVTFPGDEEFAFRHALFREAAYAMLTEDDSALGHRLAGGWLEKRGVRDAAVLAEHFERGRSPRRAIPWYRAAIAQAIEANDLAGTIALGERAVAAGAAGDDLGAIRLAQAEANRWRGAFPDALRCAEEAASAMAHGSAVWCLAMGELVLDAARMSDHEKAHRAVDALLAARTEGVGEPLAFALASLGPALLSASAGFERVDAVIAELARLEGEAGGFPPSIAGRYARLRSMRALIAGDVGGTVELGFVQNAAFDRAGDRRNAWLARIHVGIALTHVGDWAEACRIIHEGERGADELGLVWLVQAARQNRGYALAHLGKLDEAREVEEAAVEFFTRVGDRRMNGATRTYLARIYRTMGRLEDAEREARASATILEGSPLQTQGQAVLAEVLLARGDVNGALAAAWQAAKAAELHGAEEGEALMRACLIEALLRSGDVEGARRRAIEARTWLLARAVTIADPHLRSTFLESIGDHAHLLRLAQELGV